MVKWKCVTIFFLSRHWSCDNASTLCGFKDKFSIQKLLLLLWILFQPPQYSTLHTMHGNSNTQKVAKYQPKQVVFSSMWHLSNKYKHGQITPMHFELDRSPYQHQPHMHTKDRCFVERKSPPVPNSHKLYTEFTMEIYQLTTTFASFDVHVYVWLLYFVSLGEHTIFLLVFGIQ